MLSTAIDTCLHMYLLSSNLHMHVTTWFCIFFITFSMYNLAYIYYTCATSNLLLVCTILLRFSNTFVTGPVKRDQVGTKYTLSQNCKYLESFVHYLLSVSCNICHIKLSIGGQNSLQWLYQVFSYVAIKLKNVVKFFCPLGLFLLAQSHL